MEIERETQGQANTTTWHEERRQRITASNFGRFMTRKVAVNEAFLTSVFRAKPFSSAATSYGSCNEKVARQLYSKKTNYHVHDCGLVINPAFPFLGASPDGKVCDDGNCGILEIKCPFSLRDKKLDDAVNSGGSNLFLERREGRLALKHSHVYWYQVQGQLLITNAQFCDFVTFTRCDLNIERIEPHPETQTLILQKLTDIYVKHVKPFLSSP